MKTISQLQDEKLDLESKLKSITSYHEDGSSYYIDEDMAKMIQEQIVFLEMTIDNLGKEIRDRRDEDEAKEQVLRRNQRDTLVSSARSFYNEQLTAYMNLNFWRKAIAMFTGKKPKKMSDKEILEIYGQNALETLIEERITSIMEAKEEQLSIAKGTYDINSKEYMYVVQEIESIYEDKIERTRAGYETELETAIKSSSPRRGMR